MTQDIQNSKPSVIRRDVHIYEEDDGDARRPAPRRVVVVDGGASSSSSTASSASASSRSLVVDVDVFVDALVVVDVSQRGPALRTEAPGAAHGGSESAHRGPASHPTEALGLPSYAANARFCVCVCVCVCERV